MFGLFKSRSYEDASLGTFTRRWGTWRGKIKLGTAEPVPLTIKGDRAAPGSEALSAARALPLTLTKLRPAIEEELFAHAKPYLEALGRGEISPPEHAALLRIKTAADTWNFIQPRAVAIKPIAGELTIELALAAAWDEEHTLGVYIRDGRLVEFNASILAA